LERRYVVLVFVRCWLLAGPEPARYQAVGAPCVQVGQEDGDRLAHEPPPVEDVPEPAELEARVLQVKQFGSRQVDGDLLIMSFPAGRLAFIGDGWKGRSGAQQLRDPGNAYPARPSPSCCHRPS